MKCRLAAAAGLAALCVWGWGSAALAARPLMTGPEVGAKSAVVVEALTGRVVFWQEGDLPLPMASTTKIMATMLALEQPGLDEPFVVDPNAIRVEGSSMGLREGDTVTLRALCYGMMLASGNDAANAAAVRCAGSMEAFVERMNRRAADLGLKDTHFVTPSGLDAEGHQSTAHDMALLLRAALQNPEFLAISGSSTAQLEYGNPPYKRWLTNHNKLLQTCEGTIAGKTGFTQGAGRCLVTAVQREGVTLICATLGCPDDWNVHRQLYDRCFELLEPVDLAARVEGMTLEVQGGGAAPLAVGEDNPVLPLTAAEAESLTVDLLAQPILYAPVAEGDWLGQLDCRIGGTTIWRCDLTAAGDVPLAFQPVEEEPGFWQRVKGWFSR